MSSRLEDLRELARMRDEGKISQREYDIVKTGLVEAPAEEWAPDTMTEIETAYVDEGAGEEGSLEEEDPAAVWLATMRQLPTTYRAAVAGAVLVLLVGGFIATRSDAAGTVTAAADTGRSVSAAPSAGSLGIALDDLAGGWNAVDHPPRLSGGITISPEPGPLDSFLHRFDGSALLAGAYDPGDGSVYALMVRANLHDPSINNLYAHCNLGVRRPRLAIRDHARRRDHQGAGRVTDRMRGRPSRCEPAEWWSLTLGAHRETTDCVAGVRGVW